RAYGQAISDAFKHAELIEVEYMVAWDITCAYADEPHVRRLCDTFAASVTELAYTESATISIKLKQKLAASFEAELVEILKGQVSISKPG
ncbi:DUF1949 domain-containing protein, partial [Acinetobacter baumannii]